MLNTLNFVRGGVSKKDMVPILMNFHIYDGRIQGTNGRLTIDAPCAELKGMHFTVLAEPFLKAVDACEGEPKLKVLDGGGRLQISRGKFKAILPLNDHDTFPVMKPDGVEGHAVGKSLLTELKLLEPFIADDASKDWACGMLFRKGSAFATNNIIFATVPAYEFAEDINLPSFAVEELIRLNLPIEHFKATYNSATFMFENGAWMRSVLFSTEWPDVMRFLPESVTGTKVTRELISDIKRILPFCPDPKNPVIRFTKEGIATMDGDKNAIIADHTLPESAWRAEPLLSVLAKASEIDFTAYPAPCPFKGDGDMLGVIIGFKI